MEKEDISFLKQMLSSMKDTIPKLNESYGQKDYAQFNEYKKIFTKLGEEINKKLNGN
jgi:hypothetical protein